MREMWQSLLTFHCQTNWGHLLTNPFSEILFIAEAAERGAARFSHLSAMPVVAVVVCLGAMLLHRTLLMR
jgi:hypothetical protein